MKILLIYRNLNNLDKINFKLQKSFFAKFSSIGFSKNISFNSKIKLYQKPDVLGCNRFKSSSPIKDEVLGEDLTTSPTSSLNDLSVYLEPSLTSLASNISSEPTLTSLGLGGFSPSGLIQSGLEALHVSLLLPWWSSIVLGTIFIRILIFPLVIKSQKNAVHLNNHMPTIERLKQQMILARMSGDVQAVLNGEKKLVDYMKVNQVNPLKSMLVPLAQIPIFLSVFTGIRQMTNLPVESLKDGGLYWFKDLTICDPYLLLPLMTISTLYATIEVGVDGIKANQMGSGAMKLILRLMPVIVFPFIIKFPAAMLCYWFTSNTFSLIQVLFLKIPQVKKYFEIPDIIEHQTAHKMKEFDVPKQGFMESFRQTMQNFELARQMEERNKLNSLKMKQSSRSISTDKSFDQSINEPEKVINQSNVNEINDTIKEPFNKDK